MLRLEYTQEAEDNLNAMFHYGVAYWGEAHAQRYLNKFAKDLSILCLQPEIGKLTGELRLLPIDQYMIIYTFNEENVTVHSIRPKGQPR